MKKLLGVVILGLLLSGNAYAKTIYCYKANKGSEILKSTIATDLKDSSSIYFFEINDKSKNVEWLKYYWEYKREIKYSWEDNNTYEFVYDDENKPIAEKQLKFNKNEILMYWEFKNDEKEIKFRQYFELDRISGLLLIRLFKLDSEGNEITTDEEGNIYKKADDDFIDFADTDKFFCENHKGI